MPHPTTLKTSLLSRLQALFGVVVLVFLFTISTDAVARSDDPKTDIFTKCWDYKLVPNLSVEMASDAGVVYVSDIANRIHAIDLTAGTKTWSSEFGGDIVSNLLVIKDAVVFATSTPAGQTNPSGKSIIRALSRHTGITLWQAEVSTSQRIWLGAANGNAVAVGSDGWSSAFGSSDGKLIWTSTIGSGVVAEPVFRDADIRLGTRSSEVIAVDGQSGKFSRIWKSRHSPTAILNDSNNRLLVGDDRGNLTAVSASGDRLWRFRNGAQISSVAEYDSEYVAASYDNFIYKLSRGGNVEWKRRLPGRVSGNPVTIGDTAAVAIVGTGSVYGVNLRNGKILDRIEVGAEVSLSVVGVPGGSGFVIAGPDALSYYGSKCPAK